MPPMRAAALQFDVRRGGWEHNLAEAEALLREAAARGVQLACLPEMWATSFPGAGVDFELELDLARRASRRVAALGTELGLAVLGSGYGPLTGEPARPVNRLELWLPGSDEPALAYDKVHLFSPTAEHESFAAGRRAPETVATPLGRISGCICYDLRFPELTRAPFYGGDAGAEVLCVPAQWPVTRAGHFRALAMGVAITNQCFVVAVNRTGSDVVGRRELRLDFPGNSLLVDPHGRVLAEGGGERGVIDAELDLAVVRELRRRVPVARDLRLDLYGTDWHPRD